MARKIKDLNPVPQFDIGGTDLAIPARLPNGQIGFVLGDTFGGPAQAVGGPNWRSPILLKSDTHDISKPIEISGAARSGRQLVDYVHNQPEFSTILPCDLISIGSRLYLWVMYTAGLGNERYCKIWTSEDGGENWDTSGPRWSTSVYGGKRTMVTWDKGGDGFVYIMSTGGLARDKNVILFRCPEARLTDQAAWEPWGYDGSWGWGKHPGDDPTRGILQNGYQLGEICLRNIQGNWVLSGFDRGAYNAFVKVAAKTTDNWWTAPDYRPISGGDVPQLYGCYIHPDSKFNGPFCMIVSQWNTASGNPYRAMQYLIDGIRPVVQPTNPPVPTPAPEPVPKEDEVATADEVAAVTVGTTTDYDGGRPDGGTSAPTNLWGATKRILFEATLWLRERNLADLQATADRPDTALGHAVRAASFGRLTYAQGEKILAAQKRIEDKLDLIINKENGNG